MMIINFNYITMNDSVKIPLTHKGDTWLIIGKCSNENIPKYCSGKNLYTHKTPSVCFTPRRSDKQDHVFCCKFQINLEPNMYAYLGGNTDAYLSTTSMPH